MNTEKLIDTLPYSDLLALAFGWTVLVCQPD